MTPFTSIAATRRAFAQLADADRLSLAAPIAAVVGAGSVAAADAVALLSAYLFDPRAGALLALDPDRATWLDGPLFTWIGPGNAAPVHDQLAALVVGPALGTGTALTEVARTRRFAPRADDAIAIAVAALELPAQATVLEALFAEPGPDAELLGLSLVQCGRVLAWAPHLLEWPIAEQIVDALLGRLSPSRPRPHLDAVARALGPIAARPGPLGDKIRAAVHATLDAMTPAPAPASFLEQVTAISGARGELEAYKALPRREVAHACGYVLGFAAPLDRVAFVDHRARVLDRPDADELFLPFVDGLIAAGHAPAVAELVEGLLVGEAADVATGLGLAAALPLDDIAAQLVDRLDAPSAASRIQAVGAIELLEATPDVRVDDLLALRLGDPSPEVCAAAARALVARGRRDLLGRHSAREPHHVRRAVVLAGLGELSVAGVADLAAGTMAGLEAVDPTETTDDREDDVSPITRLLADCLLGSVDGLEVACDLIGGVPDAVGMLALASLPGAERDIGVLAPPAVRTRLAQVTIEVATDNADTELGTLALYLLARMSAGDETIAEVVADALTASEGFAAQLLAALGELRVASEHTAAALAPLLAPDAPVGARITAAAISGRTLPADHASWGHVRDLLTLGTIARAAAWTGLRDRARRQP